MSFNGLLLIIPRIIPSKRNPITINQDLIKLDLKKINAFIFERIYNPSKENS